MGSESVGLFLLSGKERRLTYCSDLLRFVQIDCGAEVNKRHQLRQKAGPVATVTLQASGVVFFEDAIWSFPYADFPEDLVPVSSVDDLSVVVTSEELDTTNAVDEFTLTTDHVFVGPRSARLQIRADQGYWMFGERKLWSGHGFLRC